MAGNTSDKTTLRDFLQRIEAQYGKAGRTWVMDCGIPTEAVLAEMETPTHYLVGTPRGRLRRRPTMNESVWAAKMRGPGARFQPKAMPLIVDPWQMHHRFANGMRRLVVT